MPLYSDENRIRELERKINRLIQDNRDLKQQVMQANQTARAITNPQAQGGQQPTLPTFPIRGAVVATTITGRSGSTAGTGTADIYLLSGSVITAGPTGINVYNTFTGSIAVSTWILVQLDESNAYQVVAEQC